jgi:hypothetical protein
VDRIRDSDTEGGQSEGSEDAGDAPELRHGMDLL